MAVEYLNCILAPGLVLPAVDGFVDPIFGAGSDAQSPPYLGLPTFLLVLKASIRRGSLTESETSIHTASSLVEVPMRWRWERRFCDDFRR